MPLKQPLLPTK